MCVVSLRDVESVEQFGGKAFNLARMLMAGLPVPNGFAVGLSSFDKNGKLTNAAKTKIANFIKSKLYAVRSSATAEDAAGASWAGQFESFLNVKPENIIKKIEECHVSAKERAKSYAKERTKAVISRLQ